MVGVKLNGIIILHALTFTSAVPAEQGSLAGGEPGLRRRLAGAWRSVREQPRLDVERMADHKDTGEKPTFHGMSMDAVAKKLAELDQVLYFDGDLCVMASDGRQMIFSVRYDDGIARCVNLSTGMAMPGELTIVDGMLVHRIPAMNFKVRYRRLEETPESVRLDAYELGTRQPDDAERAAIQREIARRMKQDQAVRSAPMNAAGNSPTGFDEETMQAIQAMVTVDQENTNRLVELIQDVGWLSKARFGRETERGAFLIVQHSGSVRLMRTVLPLIAKEAKRDSELGQSYALLYDRLQISTGKKQRYGSQVQTNPDGSRTIGRLEDRARTNEWRKEMGMEPLEAYARELERMTGVRVHIGE